MASSETAGYSTPCCRFFRVGSFSPLCDSVRLDYGDEREAGSTVIVEDGGSF